MKFFPLVALGILMALACFTESCWGGTISSEKTTTAMAGGSYVVDDVVMTAEFATGNGGGGIYDVIAGTASANGYNIIAHNIDSISFVLRVDREVVLEQFGTTFDGSTDDTAAVQAAFTYASDNRLPVATFRDGLARITSTLTYVETATDAVKSSGLLLRGAGMGKTRFKNEVSYGPMISVESTSPYFAKGGVYEDFTIVGDDGAVESVGIKTKGAWFTTMNRVRILGHNGIAFVAGDDTALNPDTTANAVLTFNGCQFESNYGGFKNPVNNNAPLIFFVNCSITNNSRFGIKANSSYLMVKGGAVSYNGVHDGANAEGGIVIAEEPSTTVGSGYRAKGVRIENCELDTNYPYNVDLSQCENPVITGCSTQFRDSDAIDWAAAGITQFPEAQFKFGGSTATEKCFGAVFENNRVGIIAEGNISFLGSGHSIFLDDTYAQGTKIRDLSYNLEVGFGVAGTDWYVLKEESKVPAARDARKYYVDFKFPVDNFDFAALWPDAFDFVIPRVLPSYQSLQNESMHYAFTITDNHFKQIAVPQMYSDVAAGTNYNMLCVTFNGHAAVSAIVLVRATSGASASIMSNGSTNINVASGPLSGTTGSDGHVTISADTDGTVYIENRLGATYNVHCSWLLSPGIANQY